MALSSIKTGLVFTISKVSLFDVITTWSVRYNHFFHLHILFCFLIEVTMVVTLMKYILRGSKYNRRAYTVFLLMFLICVLVDMVFILNTEQMIFDWTGIVSGMMFIYLYNFLVYSIPGYLRKNMLLLSSETVTDAILCFDDSGNYVYGNAKARTFYKNRDYEQKWTKEYLDYPDDFLSRVEKVEIEGEKRAFRVEFRRIRDDKNRCCGSYIKLNECTKEMLSMEREAYRAIHDELTGLYNRDYFFREMTRILKAEPDVPRYLVCTDIKDFKLVNELFGSEFGDRLLVRQAEMLQQADYPGVIHGRISGDRYAMLIPKAVFNPEAGRKNTDKIIELEKEINFKLTILIGIYEITDPTENVHAMYDKATLAIKNIQPGSNIVFVYYDRELMDKLLLEKSIVNEFDDALDKGQFEMYLQPQINVKTKKCCGAEALVRWNHPQKGLIKPNGFIKALEKSDQIYKLDYYIWELAVKKLSEWKKKNIDQYISVNISAKDFYYGDLYEYFKNLVTKYDVPADKLKLEITESVIVNNDAAHLKVLNQLKEYGFKIEMDDFGSGYSSLSALKDISMDVLKIDMGFLNQTDNESRADLIIGSIIKMAKKLNMEIISEGVETEKHAELLETLGADIFQGYLYSKPIPVSEYEKNYLEVE